MTQQILDNGETYGIHRGKINANFTELYSVKLEAAQVLTLVNTTVFTPTLDYHPATKLYADQLRINWDSVFNPQNINADVFDRPNHTGVQGAATITQDVDNRFVSDVQVTNWNQKEDAIGAKGTAFNKSFGTIVGTVAEGNHSHTKADIGLGNVDNTSDVDKPVSTLQGQANDVLQANIDLKQDSADLESDITSLVVQGNIPFVNFLPTKAITSDHTVDINSDYGLIVAATVSDIVITLPLLSALAGRPYQILEIIPIVANGYKVKIACQGADTFPFGNTWFDLPFSQKQFAIGLHPHGFNLRRNITVIASLLRDTNWNSSNFGTPTAIPWTAEIQNTQNELIDWDIGDPGKVYVRTTGTWTLSGGVNIAPAAVQSWEVTVSIYKNGILIPEMIMITGGDGNNKQSIFSTMPIDLVKDDYIEMRAEHSGSAAVDLTLSQFSIDIRL